MDTKGYTYALKINLQFSFNACKFYHNIHMCAHGMLISTLMYFYSLAT